MKTTLLRIAIPLSCSLLLGAAAQAETLTPQQAFGPSARNLLQTPLALPLRFGRPDDSTRSFVVAWNEIAINASGLDHTPVGPTENRIFGQQLGPARASRAIAITQIAVFDAMIAIEGGFRSYTGIERARGSASIKAAIAQAAHDTLASLYPSQAASFHVELADSLGRIRDSRRDIERGSAVGARAAQAILALRANDGSATAEPRLGVGYITSNDPGKWRQDPISQVPIALGAFWSNVRPFVMSSSTQFRIPPPPALNSAAYAAAFAEVKALGGDGVTTPTTRTADQTEIGVFWAYDGVPTLCAPPRLYNQVALTIANDRTRSPMQLARLLALVNVAMADTGIASWESKFFYNYWRPVGGLREADAGTGPSGLGDGNPATVGDPNFSPLGGQASNLIDTFNFTPPFPAYPSGHAAFGGALFQVLRSFYGTDRVPFTFISDEFNGVTKDNLGNIRPLRPRSYTTLSQAAEENGQSRIYLGIHWSFDKSEGITQGERVGDFVFDHVYQPSHH
jgi:hypothetical protein